MQEKWARLEFRRVGADDPAMYVGWRAGGTLIRVISACDMHRKEKVIYAQA